MTTLDEVRRYEELNSPACARLGRDLIWEGISKLHAGVVRDGAPIAEFEKCAVAYAEEMHRVTPDERGRAMAWRCMVVMRDLLGVALQ